MKTQQLIKRLFYDYTKLENKEYNLENFKEYRQQLNKLKYDPIIIAKAYYFLIINEKASNKELSKKLKIGSRETSRVINLINNSNLFHIPILSANEGYYLYFKHNHNKAEKDISIQSKRAIEVIIKNNKIRNKINELEKTKLFL